MSDATGAGSLTALPVIECGLTRLFKMQKLVGGETVGKPKGYAMVKSNPKDQDVRRIGERI
jgi:hypothetical protein